MTKNYHELREWLSEQEHIQWKQWSETIAKELQKIRNELTLGQGEAWADGALRGLIHRWKKNWKPYKELEEDVKDFDREWADKILDGLPFKCPVYQCGGFMIAKERKPPKDFIESEHYDGDEQTPNLICTNCKAVYQFKGFNRWSKKRGTV